MHTKRGSSFWELSCKWDNDIKVELKYIGCEDLKWIELVQGRVKYFVL
jgi:hypothetical protein